MFKKLTAMALVLGMVLSIFSGCHQGVPASGTLITSARQLNENWNINIYAFRVVLTEEAAKNIDEYGTKDFPEVKPYDLSVKKYGDDRLWLAFKSRDKETTFEKMKLILQRSDVLGVEPYIYEASEETDDPDAVAETQVTKLGVVFDVNSNYSPFGFSVTLTDEAVERIDEYGIEDFPELEQELLYVKKSWSHGLRFQLEEPSKETIFEAIKLVKQRDDVYDAEPAFYGSLDEAPTIDTVIPENNLFGADVNSDNVLEEDPTDAYYAYQWAGDKIQLSLAWDEMTRTDEILVGVLDTGIDGCHEDLNGVIDWELSREFDTMSGEMMDTRYESASEIEDIYDHGTMVAGIIAAQCHNDVGIAGMSKTVKLVSLRITDAEGTPDGECIAAAIEYATEVGIPILNISATVTGSDKLAKAISNYPGLIICSAGNANANTDTTAHYPSTYNNANIIAVGSSTSTDTRASTSNYGATTVDIFAPGVSIISCYPTNLCKTSDCGRAEHFRKHYHINSGTSFAAPHVTGVAALVWTQYPDLTAAQVKARILDYADDVNEFSSLCVSGGRLNAYKAVHAHNYAYNDGTITSSAHTLHCTVCNHSTTASHSYKATTQTATSHTMTCTVCGRTESGSHSYTARMMCVPFAGILVPAEELKSTVNKRIL